MPRPSNAPTTPPAPAPYRPTRGDRLGPDAALIYRVIPHMIVMFGCFALLFFVLKGVLGYPAGLIIPLALATTAILTR